MLCINHLLFNKISSSHRYKETVSFLNGKLAPLFQSAMVAAKKYQILLNLHLITWLWHIKIFASLQILLLGYYDILMHLKMSISTYDQFVSELDIPTSITLGLMQLQMQQSISPLQFQRLLSEFYWRSWNPYKLFLKLLSRLGFFLLVIFPRPFLL